MSQGRWPATDCILEKERQPRIQANNLFCKVGNKSFSLSTGTLEPGRLCLSACTSRARSACISRKQMQYWLQDSLLSLSNVFNYHLQTVSEICSITQVLKICIVVTKMLLQKNTRTNKIYKSNQKMSLIHSSIKSTHSQSFQHAMLAPRTTEVSSHSLSLVKWKKLKVPDLLSGQDIQASRMSHL